MLLLPSTKDSTDAKMTKLFIIPQRKHYIWVEKIEKKKHICYKMILLLSTEETTFPKMTKLLSTKSRKHIGMHICFYTKGRCCYLQKIASLLLDDNMIINKIKKIYFNACLL